MTERDWDDDDQLLEDLSHAVLESAPLAHTVASHAETALCWRTIDRDLLVASLSFDSSIEPAKALRAGSQDPRVLIFTSSPLSVELEILPEQVVGQIVPPEAAEIIIETTDGFERRVTADESGFFELPMLRQAPVRLRCDTPTGRVVTDWVRL